MRLCLAFFVFAAAAAAAQAPFGVALHDTTVGAPAVFHLGPPDDVCMGLGMSHVTFDFFAAGIEIYDGAGPDVTVYEIDQGGIEFPWMNVLVSLDGVTYTSIKSTELAIVRIPGDNLFHVLDAYGRSYDIAGAGLPAVRYVRVQGAGLTALIDHNCVDFDLDAIGAVNSRPITVLGTATAALRIERVQVEQAEVAAGETDVAVLVTLRNIGLATATSLGATLSFTGSADRGGEYSVVPFAANPDTCTPGEEVLLRFAVDVAPGATLESIIVDSTATGMDSFAMNPIMTAGAQEAEGWNVVAVAGGLQPVRFPELAITPNNYPGFVYERAPDDWFSGLGAQTVNYDLLTSGTCIVDLPGVDFNVYEVDHGSIEFAGINVLVSDDGVTFTSVKASETALLRVGGDSAHGSDAHGRSYDLSGSGVPRAYYVRVVGMGAGAAECTNGFDLDGLALHHPDIVFGVGAAGLSVRTVAAADDTVAGGDVARQVEVTIGNTGLARVDSLSVALTFTGSGDRTAEYTVVPFAGNPQGIGIGDTVTLAFAVDVDLLATAEPITIDASVSGIDAFLATSVVDLGADITDLWQVNPAPCDTAICGDCDASGVTNILDALLAAQFSAGLQTMPALGSVQFNDCNPHGRTFPAQGAGIDVLDALAIAQSAAGLGALTCCQ